MSENDVLRRYFVTVALHAPTRERFLKVGTEVQKVLKAASVTPPEMAFAAGDGSVFSCFVKSSLRAGEIHNRINSPGGQFDMRSPPILEGHDTVFVLEIGADFSISRVLGRAAAWLQRK
jgi:hypothetical protein